MPIPAHLKQRARPKKDGTVTLFLDPVLTHSTPSGERRLSGLSIKKGLLQSISAVCSEDSTSSAAAEVARFFSLKADSLHYTTGEPTGRGGGEMVFDGDFVDGGCYIVGGELATSVGDMALSTSGATEEDKPKYRVALGFCPEMQEHAPSNPRIVEAPLRLQRALEGLGVKQEQHQEEGTTEVKTSVEFPERFDAIPTRKATLEEISAAHDKSVYRPFLEGKLDFGSTFLEASEAGLRVPTSKDGKDPLPSDVYWSQDSKSSEAVLYAAGITIEGARHVIRGGGGKEDSASRSKGDDGTSAKNNNAFALVRPPGHHCGYHTPNGFCLVNNVAIALQDIRKQYPLKKLMVIDFDVHHGEGTQSLIESWNDSNVAFISLHRYDEGTYFPSTGHIMKHNNNTKKPATPPPPSCAPENSTDALMEELLGSVGKAWYDRGLIMNIPFDTAPMDLVEGGYRTMSDYCFALVTQELILPALEKFLPDLIVFSAGFDASAGDPLGGMAVVNGFELMVSAVAAWAHHYPPLTTSSTSTTTTAGDSSKKQDVHHQRAALLAVLEGGYNPQRVASGVEQVVKAMENPERFNKIFVPMPGTTSISAWKHSCTAPPSWAQVRKKQKLKVEELKVLEARRLNEQEKAPTPPPEEVEPKKVPSPTKPEDIRIQDDEDLMEQHCIWAREQVQRVTEAHTGSPLLP